MGSKALVSKAFSKDLTALPTHTVHLGWMLGANGDRLDEVLATLFDHGKSFTGEESVELACHGSTFIQQLYKQYFRLFDYQSTFSQQFKGDPELNYLSKYQISHKHPLVKTTLIVNTIFYCVILMAMVFGLIVSIVFLLKSRCSRAGFYSLHRRLRLQPHKLHSLLTVTHQYVTY